MDKGTLRGIVELPVEVKHYVKASVPIMSRDISYIVEEGLNWAGWYNYSCIEGAHVGFTEHEQVANGGAICVHIKGSSETFILSQVEIYSGLVKWADNGHDEQNAITLEGLKCRNIGPRRAAEILQYALFGKLRFPDE